MPAPISSRAILSTLAVGLAAGWGCGEAPVKDPCPIADSALQAAVAEELGRGSGPVPRAEMAALEFLDARDAGISNLEGIQCAAALTNLSIGGNDITDLSPLSELDLEVLDAGDNEIDDLSPLAGLSRLRSLRVAGNDLESFEPVAVLPLANLDVSDNRLTRLDGLDGLTALSHLSAAGNALEGLAEIEAVASKLILLDLDRCELSDIADLPASPQLRDLHLSGNAFTSVPSMVNFPQLMTLNLGHNAIADIENIDGSYAVLTLDANPVSDFGGLRELTVLSINDMPNVPDLSTLPTLTRLDAERSGITDAELATLAAGSYSGLLLRGNAITDPTPIVSLGVQGCGEVLLADNPLDPQLTSAAHDALCGQGVMVSLEDGETPCNAAECGATGG